jgi:hypothetical protein
LITWKWWNWDWMPLVDLVPWGRIANGMVVIGEMGNL